MCTGRGRGPPHPHVHSTCSQASSLEPPTPPSRGSQALYPSLGHAKGSRVHAQEEHFLGALAVACHVAVMWLPRILHRIVDNAHRLWKLQLAQLSIEPKLLLQEALSQASRAELRLHQDTCRLMERPWWESLGHSHVIITWKRDGQRPPSVLEWEQSRLAVAPTTISWAQKRLCRPSPNL